MVAVVDYEAGNVRSVVNALARLGAEVCVTDDHDAIRAADRVVLPGVGHAGRAMADLQAKGLDEVIRSLSQPVLGVCIGMQLMCRRSDEGAVECMGIFEADVRKMEGSGGCKIPHMGWNAVRDLSSGLFDGFDGGEYLYYVHSYAAGVCSATIATTDYGAPFSGALARGNFYGTQFHPEKSGETGERLLHNFLLL